MGNRRAFLRLAAAGAMWPSVAWSQKATKKPVGKAASRIVVKYIPAPRIVQFRAI